MATWLTVRLWMTEFFPMLKQVLYNIMADDRFVWKTTSPPPPLPPTGERKWLAKTFSVVKVESLSCLIHDILSDKIFVSISTFLSPPSLYSSYRWMFDFSLLPFQINSFSKDFNVSQNICGTEIIVATYTGLNPTRDFKIWIFPEKYNHLFLCK